MSSLNDFYSRVLQSLNLEVKEDGFVFVKNGNGRDMFTANGTPVVIPTKEHIESVLGKDEDGEIHVVKIPYNPLNENLVKKNSISLTKTKVAVEIVTGLAISVAGRLMLVAAENPELQKKTSIEVNEFLSSLRAANGPNIKKIVDDKSIDNWTSIHKKIVKEGTSCVGIYIKKQGIYEGTKYNKLSTLTSSLYDEIVSADKDTPVNGVKLRPKEITTFKLLMECLLEGIEGTRSVSVGSNDSTSAGFISLFKLYLSIVTKTNAIIKSLRFIDEEYADMGYVDLQVTEEELDKLDIYNKELLLLPNDNDLGRQKADSTRKSMFPTLEASDIKPAVDPLRTHAGSRPSLPDTPLPLQREEETDPIKRGLYGPYKVNAPQQNHNPFVGGGYTQAPAQYHSIPQQPMYQQQAVAYEPPNPFISGGYSNQPVFQQPVYNQAPAMYQQGNPFVATNQYGGGYGTVGGSTIPNLNQSYNNGNPFRR